MVRRMCLQTAAVALILLTPASWAQSDPTERFLDTIDVRVINIETVVTDGKGRRVSGLDPQDFRLLVDGEETEIGFFSEIRDGHSLVSDNADTLAAVLPPTDSDEPAAIPTNYLVFVDDVFPRGSHRNLVLKRLQKQIESLGPTDQMSIMAFNGHRLEALADWTRSPDVLQGALKTAAEHSSTTCVSMRWTRSPGTPVPTIGSVSR